jgi:hypothetical protein
MMHVIIFNKILTNIFVEQIWNISIYYCLDFKLCKAINVFSPFCGFVYSFHAPFCFRHQPYPKPSMNPVNPRWTPVLPELAPSFIFRKTYIALKGWAKIFIVDSIDSRYRLLNEIQRIFLRKRSKIIQTNYLFQNNGKDFLV